MAKRRIRCTSKLSAVSAKRSEKACVNQLFNSTLSFINYLQGNPPTNPRVTARQHLKSYIPKPTNHLQAVISPMNQLQTVIR